MYHYIVTTLAALVHQFLSPFKYILIIITQIIGFNY